MKLVAEKMVFGNTVRLIKEGRKNTLIMINDEPFFNSEQIPKYLMLKIFDSLDETTVKQWDELSQHFLLDLLDVVRASVMRHHPELKVKVKNLIPKRTQTNF